MALKTIEQLLKPVILNQLQNVITTQCEAMGKPLYTLKMTNDIRNRSKEDTVRTIPSVIQTNQGRRSTTKDFLEWQKPIAIYALVDSNFLQEFLQMVELYMQITNRYVDTVTDSREYEPIEEDVTYKYYIRWDYANKVDNPNTYEVKSEGHNPQIIRESVDMQLVYITGSIFYSVGVPIDDHQFGIYLLSGTAPGPNQWVGVTEADYNAATIKVDLGSAISEHTIELPDATSYATNAVGRVYLMTEEVYRYFKAVPNGTVDVYSYVPLIGKIQNQTQLQPSFSVTPLVDQEIPEYDLTGSTRTKSYTVQRIIGNLVHDYLMGLYFAVESNTKYDCQVELKVLSLNITKRYNAKITSIVHSEAEVGETIGFAVVLLDEIVGA